jgi:hypothetical protein
MRYTRKQVEAKFAQAMDAIGVPHGEAYLKMGNGTYVANVGNFNLDHNAVYGGYTITKIVNAGGGETCPFGMGRNGAATFVAMMNALIDGVHILKQRG